MSQRFNPLSGQFDLVLDQASEIQYDNTTSGLTATELQSAVDEIQAEIAALPDPITYKGTWSAATNTPTLSNSDTGKTGWLYQVTAAGTVNFGAGPISFDIGDKVVNNGSTWDKWDMTDAVSSVNGLIGAVVLTTTNISEGSNLYFTDERAQDATGLMATSSSKVSLTYNDVANTLTPDIVAGSLVNADINASAAIAYSKLNLSASIVNADIATAAAIARSKLASGTANHVLINDGSGVMSSEATLAVTRGGTGQSSFTDGQLLIGNSTGNTLTKASLTAGSNITITPGSGSITIAATAPNLSVSAVKTSAYSILTTDNVVLVDASGGSFNVTLPTAVGATGKQYTIKRVDQTLTQDVSIITTSSQTIDGASLRRLSTQYEQFTVVSDGSNWQILDHSYPSILVPYTPTTQGLGTPSAIELYWQRIGGSIQISGNITTGTTTASEARISTPSSIAATAFTNIRMCGVVFPDNTDGGSNISILSALAEPSVGYMTFGFRNSTSAPLTKQNGNGIFASNLRISISALIPITNWEG